MWRGCEMNFSTRMRSSPKDAAASSLHSLRYSTASASLEATRRAQGAHFIAADNYALAAILAWHLPPESRMIGAHPRWAMFALPHPELRGQSGIFLRSERLPEQAGPAPWSAQTALAPARRGRAGITAEEYRVYRVIGPAAEPGIVSLPHP